MEYQNYFAERYKSEDPWLFETSLYEKVRHAAMVEFATAGSPRTVLDLGCGEGHFLTRLLKKAPELAVTGVELIPVAAERCRQRLAGFSHNIITSDLIDYLKSQELEIFDVVVCGDVLYYLEPSVVQEVVIPQIRRHLKPAGSVVLSYTDVNDHGWLFDLFAAGFVAKEQIYIKPGINPPPWPWVVALFKDDR